MWSLWCLSVPPEGCSHADRAESEETCLSQPMPVENNANALKQGSSHKVTGAGSWFLCREKLAFEVPKIHLFTWFPPRSSWANCDCPMLPFTPISLELQNTFSLALLQVCDFSLFFFSFILAWLVLSWMCFLIQVIAMKKNNTGARSMQDWIFSLLRADTNSRMKRLYHNFVTCFCKFLANTPPQSASTPLLVKLS